MTNEEKVRYWIALSDEDLNAGRTLFSGGHYLYVGFMCHQSLEKIFKACYTKLKEETPPYTHKLIFLAQQSGFYNSLSEEQKIIISEIEPLNIEARYPEYKSSMSKLLSRRKCLELFEQTNTLQQWIKEKILSTG
ncbi:MAG: HEPN domain-containing protein [Dysgonamonadaceae bacterium]|jgi:HEPN domain-containing protein|nr:HEPN domain-containing protein [Dysgonamonadaceae bacterium]